MRNIGAPAVSGLYNLGAMRVLLILLLASGVALFPFVMLKQPWALKTWRRIRIFFVVYAVVILVSAVVALIFRWDAIYG